MEFESDEEPAFSCKLMPGYRECAKANVNGHLKSGEGKRCPSKDTCVSKYAKSPEGRTDVATMFRADVAGSLRHVGYSKWKRNKQVAEANKRKQKEDAAVEAEMSRWKTDPAPESKRLQVFPSTVMHEKHSCTFV